MTDWFDDDLRPRNWALELGDVRGLNAIAAHQMADGDYQAASEVAQRALEEMTGPLREFEHVPTPARFFWQFERLRALTCTLSAELALGHRDAAATAGQQLESAYRDLDLSGIMTFADGVCCHGNWSPTGNCQSAPPCTTPLC